MNNDKNGKGLNVLICGSQKFDDEHFVFRMLDQFYQQTEGSVKQIFTSNFSGTCLFARKWVIDTNERILQIAKEHKLQNPPIIQERDCTFDMLLLEKNASLYEQMDIPDIMLQHDPFYIKGKEMIISNNINLVIAFPNKEGILGPATYNINRFAKLAGIGDNILDCSDALAKLQEFRQNAAKNLVVEPIQSTKPISNGFSNKHPGRKF